MGGTEDSPSLSSDVEQPVQQRHQGLSDSFPEAANPETQRLQSPSDITGEVETRTEAEKILVQTEDISVQAELNRARTEEILAQAEEILRQASTILVQSQLTQVQSQMIRAQAEEMLAKVEEIVDQAEEIPGQAEETQAKDQNKDQTEEEQAKDNQKSHDKPGILKRIWLKIQDFIKKLKENFNAMCKLVMLQCS